MDEAAHIQRQGASAPFGDGSRPRWGRNSYGTSAAVLRVLHKQALYPDALRSGRFAPCTGGRVHEAPITKQTDPGHPEQPIRKRRTRRPVGPAPGVFLWGILRISKPVSAGIGAILLPPRQTCARSQLRRPIQRLNCVACRYLFRCLLEFDL